MNRQACAYLDGTQAVCRFNDGIHDKGLCVQAYKGRGEEYKLFWPKHPEFVRMAARFGATIVPFGGVGLDDGFEMLLSPQEIRGIPFVGKWLEDNAKKSIPPARRCVNASQCQCQCQCVL